MLVSFFGLETSPFFANMVAIFALSFVVAKLVSECRIFLMMFKGNLLCPCLHQQSRWSWYANTSGPSLLYDHHLTTFDTEQGFVSLG